MTLIRSTYAALLWHPKWRSKRARILERDGHRCRQCARTTALQVHHRQYHRCKQSGHKLAPWSYPDRLLITLCDACHAQGHRQFKIPSFNR